jgi:hypothetical protein
MSIGDEGKKLVFNDISGAGEPYSSALEVYGNVAGTYEFLFGFNSGTIEFKSLDYKPEGREFETR